MAPRYTHVLLLLAVVLICLPSPAAAFGAGNIASISKIEGQNFRHGDIEDFLKTVACLKGHKWSSMMVKRVYFGNWLRDYSQAVDVGTLKGAQAETIRILVWILAFMSFGYATAEFEVTAERLGVYRPEEHIDNPKDYADNIDARQFDARLRGPVMPQELEIDPNTGMKNYIANEHGGWATSAGYIKYSFERSIHFGRVYTSASRGVRGRQEDLCEALRCLGQGLHCLEDFGAHSNYTELALRELGYHNVFPHTGSATQMNLHGKHVFPLVTGTFGGVDFLHSVLGEATDHFTQSEVSQSEVDQMNATLGNAVSNSKRGSGDNECEKLTGLLSKLPGTNSLCQEARALQASADAQAAMNFGASRDQYGASGGHSTARADPPQFSAPPGSTGGPPGPGIPGMSSNFDPTTIVPKIYPILAFRDKVVRAISAVVSKIPGLEALIENITERVTIFVFSLLAPFVQPLIAAASKSLKAGSSAVVDSSARHQYEPWTNPHCTDPTHSLLSKDHFSNILNEPAGKVAAAILQYVAPRIIYAWDHPEVPVDQVLHDTQRVLHHPALRDMNLEIHRSMFHVVEEWSRSRKPGSPDLNVILSSESVKAGKNHVTGGVQEALEPGLAILGQPHAHGHGMPGMHGGGHGGGHGSSPLSFLTGGKNPLASLTGHNSSPFSAFSSKRDIDDFATGPMPGGYDTVSTDSPGQAPYEPPYSPNPPYSGHMPPPAYGQGYAPAPSAPAFGAGYSQGPPGEYQGGYNQPPAPASAYGAGYDQGPQGGYQGGYDQQQPPTGDWRPQQQEGDGSYGNWNPSAQGPYGQAGGGYSGGY